MQSDKPDSSIALTITALSRRKQIRMQLTIISGNSYTEVLQEALGLSQRFLKDYADVVRVEIRREQDTSQKPLVVLTHEDLLSPENGPQKKPVRRFSSLFQQLQRFFSLHPVSTTWKKDAQLCPAESTHSEYDQD